jgi:uncharacterized protein (DUF1015 family)
VMVALAPFCGWRYNPLKISKLDEVVSPPYDVIDNELQKELHRRHPWNVIRLELGEDCPWDNEEENRYTRARRYLDDWRSQGVLVRDEKPALYVYHHRFKGINGEELLRKGFMALVKLEPLDQGTIFPHEETFPTPKQDRLELLRACRAQFNPIFSVFPDPKGDFAQLLHVEDRPPEMRVLDEKGVEHSVWAIAEPELVGRAVSLLAKRPAIIADGHHRYETSLQYQQEQKAQWDQADPSNWTLMYLTPMEDPGLVIFPTHKLVRGLENLDLGVFMESLAHDFHMEEIPFREEEPLWARKELTRRLHNYRFSRHCALGLVVPGAQSYWVLRFKDTGSSSPHLAHLPECLRSLDVTVLHEVILKGRLGIDVGDRGHSHLLFSHDLQEALQLAEKEKAQLLFLMNPVPVAAFKEIATSGYKMPQKATYFYPKLLSGLVIRTMEEGDRVVWPGP